MLIYQRVYRLFYTITYLWQLFYNELFVDGVSHPKKNWFSIGMVDSQRVPKVGACRRNSCTQQLNSIPARFIQYPDAI